jgi:hypothetical protein
MRSERRDLDGMEKHSHAPSTSRPTCDEESLDVFRHFFRRELHGSALEQDLGDGRKCPELWWRESSA